jgi:hypothetical protein
MGVFSWIHEHWFDLLQTVGIVGGLLFTSLAVWRDDRSRKISNLISINQQYREIWKELYERPELSRLLDKNADVVRTPVSDQESLFINLLILHLDSVFRATRAGMAVKFEGLQKDVAEFFKLPIPKAVWRQMKPFHNKDFVRFIEAALK